MYEVLVIMQWISTHDLTNLATKITKFGLLGQKLQPLFISRLLEMFSPRVFQSFFAIFNLIVKARTLLVIMVCIYTCESMILATKIIKISQLKLKVWTFFKPKSVEVFSIKGFFGCFTISTLIICAWIILAVMISTYPRESMILATEIINGSAMEMVKHP